MFPDDKESDTCKTVLDVISRDITRLQKLRRKKPTEILPYTFKSVSQNSKFRSKLTFLPR